VELRELHGWDLSPSEAVALQRRLSPDVVLKNKLPKSIRTVAGVDVSYEKGGGLFHAAVVVLSFPELDVVDESSASGFVTFPYVPGLLSFRELPVLLHAFRGLDTVPDAVLVDGQGIAHPRRLGLASHLGLWLDIPTVGCAKSRLCGEHEEPGLTKGDRSPLLVKGEVVGAVLRSRAGVKPLYVSPGHLVDVVGSADFALACCKRYRMPEPTRLAHLLSNRLRSEARRS